MKKWEENKEGIADALKAMWDDCQKGDFDAAAEEFATAQSLADDDSDEMAEGDAETEGPDKKEGGGKGKGLMIAVFGKKPGEK